jgi:DNA-binding LytR/AlgR family response regulator
MRGRPQVRSGAKHTVGIGEWLGLPQRRRAAEFVRIHCSSMNLEYVERLEPWSHASQHVYLRGLRALLTMSRRFGARLRDRFG